MSMDEATQEDIDARNLIVNYLPYTVDQDGLRAIFEPHCGVETCRVIVDRNTGQPLGYGFVLADSPEGAQRAIAELTGHEIGLKRLKVSLACDGRKENTHVYVAGLDREATREDISAMFSPYGEVEDVKILREPGTTISRGVAFVHYTTKRGADAAIDALNDAIPPGGTTPITVRHAEQRNKGFGNNNNGLGGNRGGYGRGGPMGGGAYAMQPQHYGGQGGYDMHGGDPSMMMGGGGAPMGVGVENPESTLFVFNLPPQTDEGGLMSMFSHFGAITSAKVVRDQVTRMCKGYGFVSYTRREEAALAIAQMNGFNLAGKNLVVSFKRPKNQQR